MLKPNDPRRTLTERYARLLASADLTPEMIFDISLRRDIVQVKSIAQNFRLSSSHQECDIVTLIFQRQAGQPFFRNEYLFPIDRTDVWDLNTSEPLVNDTSHVDVTEMGSNWKQTL